MYNGLKSIAFVLQWHPDCVMGGAKTQAWLIAQELAARGWHVSYISEWPRRWAVPKIKNGVRLYRLPALKSELSFLNSFALWRVMSAIRANVYYQRVVSAYTGLVVRISYRVGASSVWASSHILDCARGRMYRAWKENPSRRLRRLLSLPLVLTVDRIAEYGILNVDQIVAQTREQKVAIQHTWGREAIVVPNAHPIPPNNNCEKVTPPVVIWLGAIKPIKQPLIFLDLAAWCLDMNAPFIMAGALTDPTTVTEFKQRIGSVPNLVYLGSIPIHEASQLLQHASLLVNTSSSEGFPNVFIQAWLRNTPVVSLGVDPDGVIQANSICRCSSNFEDLVSDVRTLLANPNMLEELGKRGRNYAVQEHGLDRMVSIYEELFTGLSKRGLEARL